MHGWQAQKEKNLVPKSQETFFKGSAEATSVKEEMPTQTLEAKSPNRQNR